MHTISPGSSACVLPDSDATECCQQGLLFKSKVKLRSYRLGIKKLSYPGEIPTLKLKIKTTFVREIPRVYKDDESNV